MKRLLQAFAILGLISCQQDSAPLAPEAGRDAGLTAESNAVPRIAGALDGRYVVMLREGTGPSALGALGGARPDRVYTRAINGFVSRLPRSAIQALLRDPRVLSVEPDGVVRATEVQKDAVWGLDRIDQRALPLNAKKFRHTATGAGVTAYVIDTGIRFDHTQFGGRATSLVDVIDGDASADDCEGHGTHVAGTLGGSTYGVAKEVSLVAVRVLDCDGFGTWSGVLDGIEAVIAAHAGGAPAVANMSLGGEKRFFVNQAVKNLIADGVTTVVSAGNEFGDACDHSPASAAQALTIGATEADDRKAAFSNFGDCVDWFAPGVGIKSAGIGSPTATRFLSGTSMAAPHVSGVAALYLKTDPLAAPSEVRQALYSKTTKGLVLDAASANNHLLFTRY